MGVKAVVEAVWEPKQEGELDGLTVETPWDDEARVSEIAGWCDEGLGVVGMIYTDLTPYVLPGLSGMVIWLMRRVDHQTTLPHCSTSVTPSHSPRPRSKCSCRPPIRSHTLSRRGSHRRAHFPRASSRAVLRVQRRAVSTSLRGRRQSRERRWSRLALSKQPSILGSSGFANPVTGSISRKYSTGQLIHPIHTMVSRR